MGPLHALAPWQTPFGPVLQASVYGIHLMPDLMKLSKMIGHAPHLRLHLEAVAAPMERFHNLSRPEYRHRPAVMKNVLAHLHDWVNMEEDTYIHGEPLHFTDGGN